jgi:hypothetical protein
MRRRSTPLKWLHLGGLLALLVPVLALALPGGAVAERPASRSELAAINRFFEDTERTLHVKLAWVHVSTRGPFALAYLRGGQSSAALLHGSGTQWTDLATISDEGLRCGLAPPAVIADLDLEQYNEGPKPCAKV